MIYDEEYLNWLFSQMRRITSRGALHAKAVTDQNGKLLGWYVFFEKDKNLAKVVQLIAVDGRMDDILDSLFQYAANLGCVGIGGRVEPELVEGLARKGCHFRYGGPRSLIHSRNPEILAMLHSRQAIMTRLDGEWWTSFHRERYE